MDMKRSVQHEKTQPKESRTRRTKADPPSNIEQGVEASDSSSDNGVDFQSAEFYASVASKAYELFQRRGGEEGHDVEDWLEAERLVRDDLRQRKP